MLTLSPFCCATGARAGGEAYVRCQRTSNLPQTLQCRTAAHSTEHPLRNRYKEGGPAAEARFEAGVAGFEARSFRGCGVMTSEPFEVSDDNESLQMLTRSSQIGEFYVMSPPQIPPKGDGMHTCDLLVYDEESDRHVRITWEDALEATLCNDAQGFYNSASDTDMSDGNQNTTKLSDWKDMADEWSAYNKGGVDYKTAAGENGKNLECRIIVARPFIEHLMHNAVLTVAGRDTGATLFGPADMQLSVSQVITRTRHRPRNSSASIPEVAAD